MHRILRARLLASALALSAAPFIGASQPAHAQASMDVSFDSFHRQLEPYGTWIHHPRYGDAWEPDDADANFHPYSRGHWVNTDEYGFTWVSDYEWGSIPFHYGRWVYDEDDGWLWVPGYVWAPAWVSWRSDNDYTGWAPMPPDDRFLAGDETEFDADPVAFYGPRADVGNIFIFVGTGHVADPDFRTYIVRRPSVVTIFHRTRDITHISIVNDRVVNRSVDVHMVERAARRPIQTVSIQAALKPGATVTNVHIGHDIDIRERDTHPRGQDADHGTDMHGGHEGTDDHTNDNDHGTSQNDMHGGHPGDTGMSNGLSNNPPAAAPDQTPKHHKDESGMSSTPPDQTAPAPGSKPSTPADTGAASTPTPHKHHTDSTGTSGTPPGQTAPPASSGSTAPPPATGATANPHPLSQSPAPSDSAAKPAVKKDKDKDKTSGQTGNATP